MTPYFIAIDEEGYFISNGLRIDDPVYAQILLKNIKYENRTLMTSFEDKNVFVEAFDDPFVIQYLDKDVIKASSLQNPLWGAAVTYGYNVEFDPQTLTVDDWDRFHCVSSNGIPMVFSRKAQMELFNFADEFDDDSITINGIQYPITGYLPIHGEVSKSQFWIERYTAWTDKGEKPGFQLDEAVITLQQVLPQIKIPKSRIAVLGCGAGEDANYFAQQGHIVTGFDFSKNALDIARKKFSYVKNLTFVEADLFNLSREHFGQYDMVFEHTFFCAIEPAKRQEIIHLYRKLLAPNGHLLGIFMMGEPFSGPPFSSTEWEMRERLKTDFEFLYWTRWKTSIPDRLGRELVVYARKKST